MPHATPAPADAHDAPQQLSFRVLGPVQAVTGGVGADVRPPLCAAVLTALLLRHGRPASAAALIEDVWGDAAPPRALGALRAHVSRLRGLLEPGRAARTPARVLVSHGEGYVLRVEPGALDLAEFDRLTEAAERARSAGRAQEARSLLEAALRLWRGEPLAGVPGPYAAAQRARLAERRLAAVEARWEAELHLGGYAAATGPLRALAEDHPLRERTQELLMTALYEAGRQAEALEVHDRARRALRAAGAVPGPRLGRVHRRILAGAAAPGAVREPAALRLPPGTADFTGREDVVGRLRAALEGGRVVAVSAVSGMGGVGKTALAVHVAHGLRERFPDGQLFVDLRGTDALPADPAQVLGDFLRALGVVPGRVPALAAERAALYRSLTADRRVLVVLDNARDLGQVRDLLPGGSGCGVLVTSRTRLAGLSGAALVDLREPAPHEAWALLERLVGERRVRAEEEAARQLLEDCGRLPLAIRVVAARLVARPAASVADTARALADERRRLAELSGDTDDVETTFRLGTGLLDAEQLRAFRLLAVPDVPELTGAAAAALLDRTERQAEDLCETLVDLSLLESVGPGRYRYHDLLRLYARKTAAEEIAAGERDGALLRLLEVYVALARDAYRAATAGDAFPVSLTAVPAAEGHFPSQEGAARWLVDELPALLALTGQAARTPRIPVAVAAELLLATDPLGRHANQPLGLDRAARAVLEAAERSGDRGAEAVAHYMLGGAHAQRFELATAVRHFEVTAGICRGAGQPALLALTLGVLGGCELGLHDFAGALERLTEAVPLAEAAQSPGCVAYVRGFLGLAQLANGAPEAAMESGRTAVAVAETSGDREGLAQALRVLGQICLWLGRPDEALDCLTRSLELWRATGSRFRESLGLSLLAEAHNLLGRPDEAAACAEEARESAEQHGGGYLLGRALAQLGHASAARGRAGRAAFHYREAQALFERLGMPEAREMAARLNG
ncbi:regulatory protein AfsR [Streptomyces mashuensis]|uniref:Regulatory protein AfsR n=1 Tax=Streptomyces mashuensis TaxID=33904 RepID=A0A919EG83_9ACTN|nr:AfsR/SARP family transcriptional regulator [Streptomyces mashuensis]GHF72792.1 regulatory protein AfsR [Streptomyces mashuensis]